MKKNKHKYRRIYSDLGTGKFYLVRVPKSTPKNAKIKMRKYDAKLRKHTLFQS